MQDATAVQEWAGWLRDVRRVRGATLDVYTRTLFAFRDFVGDVPWSDVDASTVEAFMSRLRRGGVVGAAATQDRDRIALSGFFKWAQQRQLVGANPVVDVGVPRVQNRVPRAVPDELWARLWMSELPDDDRVWLGLGCFAGLRRREIVSLAPEQVDASRGLLLYLSRKGGNEDVVEFAEMARTVADRLPAVLPDAEAWIALVGRFAAMRRGERCLTTLDRPATAVTQLRMSFTDPRLPDPGQLNKRLCQLLRRAGLPERAFSPHALRHTCATNLLRAGVPIEVVSDLMGHANIDTTRRYVRTSGRLAEWRSHRGF